MGSSRAGSGGESTGRAVDLLESAVSLRWARPDLTAALADHVLDGAAIAGDQDRWLAAAGWAVHARSATGDGREMASEVLESLSRWGRTALDGRAARRLRIELALVAAGAGEVETARGLLGPVVVDESEPELRADLLCANARCAVEDAPDRVAEALRSADSAWSLVPSPLGDVGAASVALISAVVDRRNRRPDSAADHAADGLARLERGRGPGPSGTPSGHLAAALAAEWISALLDGGRADEARDGCVPLMPRLAEPARASRQLALLRLTVARAVAGGDGAASSVGLLQQAADDAAASDAPDLESVCRTALGALQEQTGPIETALETLRLGVAAERRDRTRMTRFRSALGEIPAGALRSAPAAREESGGIVLGSDRGIDRGAGFGADFGARSGSGTASVPASRRATSEPLPVSSEPEHDWDEFLRTAGGAGVPAQDSGGRGKRRRRDDDAPVDLGADQASGAGQAAGSRDERGADLRGGQRHEDERDEDERHTEPLLPRRREDWRRNRPDPLAASTRPAGSGSWDDADDAPTGEALFRSLTGKGPAPGDEPAAGTGRRNGSNGHRIGEEGGGRHESGGHERNGRTWPHSDERPAAAETGGWHLAGDPREEDVPRSRRSRENGSALDRGSDGAGRAASADPWLPDSAASGRRSAGSAPEEGSRRSESGPVENGRTSAGRRHRATDPWSTGQWPAASDGRDDRDRTEPLTGMPSSIPAAAGADDPESWLRAALADLDRVWGATGPGGEPSGQSGHRATEPRAIEPHAESRPADPLLGESRARSVPEERSAPEEHCAVVIDVAREGRRFAGRRVSTVVQAVADRLADRLPPGAQLRLGESDALSITLVGWHSADAADWMHRTLPGLLAGFEAGEDLPSAQLRAAVHDQDGPVGAQILQSLEQPGGRRHGAERDIAGGGSHERWSGLGGRSPESGGPGRRRADERDSPVWEAAPDRGVPSWLPNRSDRGSHRHEPGASGGNGGGSSNGGGRRHRLDGDPDEPARREPGHTEPARTTDRGSDRGTARDEEPTAERGAGGTNQAQPAAEAMAEPVSPTPESTEGLGIADLLAGALAAYRAI